MKKTSFLLLFILSIAIPSHAAQDFSKIEIKAQVVAEGVYMLAGSGGNIGVLATDEGLVLIDDQFAPLADKIEAAMKSIKAVPLKYIVNTHYHGDHTGSNGHFGKQAPIFAHSNVRKRVIEDNKKSGVDLPVVTYEHGVTIYLDDEEIQVMHFPNGHTDGDSIVYFKKANVLHMGDLFFQGRFPYIDLNAGGSVKGYLANIKKISNQFPPDVKIIPGHGSLTDMKGLLEFVEMVEYSVNKVDAAVHEGADSGEIMANGIGDKYKGWAWQFITEERWLKTLITDLKKSE
ncbi:MBL fold metallo-hydrolase [Thalassotalea psychrophila]|uniref:MBL fold metallo-hydrolase n=1 Tax=Thalassotalea psychrophila TaxID=3065647 RepID=A0ABY9TXZ2_9GAMM|nr:MBL fold metallo-hydrolase [Colwelliaceae bacterium SQ149]